MRQSRHLASPFHCDPTATSCVVDSEEGLPLADHGEGLKVPFGPCQDHAGCDITD